MPETGTVYNASLHIWANDLTTKCGISALALLLCLIVTSFMFLPESIAGDLPGQGNSGDWSAALPYYNLANKELNEGHFAEASANYQVAISYCKSDPDFFTNYGIALPQTR